MNSPLNKYLLSRGHNAACRASEGYPCMCWHDEARKEYAALTAALQAAEVALKPLMADVEQMMELVGLDSDGWKHMEAAREALAEIEKVKHV